MRQRRCEGEKEKRGWERGKKLKGKKGWGEEKGRSCWRSKKEESVEGGVRELGRVRALLG